MLKNKKNTKPLKIKNLNLINNFFLINSYHEKKIQNFINEIINFNKHTNLVGKSTLIDLIPKIKRPNFGTIYLDGRNYLDYNSASLRKIISFVPQNPQILSGSVSDHICYGLDNISNEKIVEFEIPTGNPLLIRFEDNLKIKDYKYLDKKREKKILFNV